MSVPPVQCVFITEDCVREWKSSNNASFKLSQPVPLLRFLYELSWTMVRGELPFPKCKVALDSVVFSDKASPHKIASNFADIVSQMAQDLTLSGEFRSRLIKLARWLVESELVPVRLLQERCEEEFLGEAEFIKIKAQELKGKEVRVNTRLLYQQTKFNLLREESEGYAKLVTLLCRDSEAPTQKGSTSTIGIIKSLIGHFDLDPNRVFDIVLECFELQPDNDVFIELIPIFPKSHASQILGFKFQYYQRMEVSNPVPYGLYRLAALLVKQDFIDLDSIYAHLLPKDVEAFEHYSTFSSKRLDEANKIGKINLAATGKDLMDEEKTGDVTIDLFAALAMETDAVDERKSELQNNQTLGLLIGFLSVDDWYHAHVLFERLSSLNPVEHIQICDSLFRLIEKSISSPYDVIRQAHLQNSGLSTGGSTDAMDVDNPSGHNSFIDLPKELFQMLACTGPFLYRDTMLLQKVCRVLRGYYLSALELVSQGDGALNPQFHVGNPNLHLKEARLRVEDALGACLLPSLQLVPANPAVGQEIWELMSLLPYEARYHLYGEWEKDDDRYPMLLAARQTAKLDTRRILKRLAKENLKQLGRMVAKLAHANPMTVLRTIVHQIEAYRDMITPVVDAFKYLTQLEYDILEYVVIERLALGGRDKLKDDGLNLSDWLQSLASFWGHLCKKYPSMELRGLFQYLVNQLKRGQGIELVLLQELIQQMANVQYTENLTEEQLDAMAGSETLKYQATSFGMTRNNKALIKSTSRLRDALLPKDEPKLATPLLLLLAQHRSLVLVNADAPYIKMVSEQFDRCHGTLLQYVDFLGSAVIPGSNYAILIPSLDDLIHLYHLDPEVAFLIYRPVMRLFKSQKTPDVCWPMEDKYSASDSSTNFESDPADYSGSMVLDIGSNKNPISWSDLLDTVKTMLPPKTWNSLSPDLYATFWGLTLYDLHVPKNRYESEIAKLHANLKSLEELSDNSSSAITKRKKEKERIQESLDRLSSELHKHEENVISVSRRLFHEKDKWLSSCPDTLKINMEFLQRCIFPRCTFSMPDAVYCAMFVHKLHSLGTPFFNTVNHIDVLICKTLQPMICCCTEFEVGRLGRFLYETLKIAYHWKSDESIYERECGNMPGFAVYYRNPNGQRVTYGQFIKVHWKWSQRITRLLIQCLESSEYMEIRNALIMLTKISSVFPVTRKSGINLEKRVAKIKSDEREDLKVLATGVAAALAARKPSWVTDEEFGMGYLELKPAPSMTKSAAGSSAAVQSGIGLHVSQTESASGKHLDSGNTVKEQTVRTKTADGKSERTESITATKSDSGHVKLKGSSMVNGVDAQSSLASPAGQSGALKSVENPKQVEESISRAPDEHITRNVESRTSVKQRSVATGSLLKPSKQDPLKEDGRSGKTVTRTSGSSSSDKDLQTHASDGRHTGTNISSSVSANGNSVSGSAKGLAPAATTAFDGSGNESRAEVGAAKSSMVKDDGNDIADFTRGSSSRVVHSPRHENTATSKSSEILETNTLSQGNLFLSSFFLHTHSQSFDFISMGICWSSTPNNPIPTGTVTPAGISSYSQAATSGSYGINSSTTTTRTTFNSTSYGSGSGSSGSNMSSSINRSNFSSVSDYSIGGQILPTSNLRVFTFAELKTATKNFRIDNLLGEGGFGKVYKGWLESPSRNSSGTTVAVKKLNTEGYQGLEEWQSEIHFLGRLYHPNLVKLLGYCCEETDLLLVYEYMQKGSLENHLFGRGAAVQPLPWDLRLKIAIGAACGLSFLHTSDKEIIYRDFKASNILLDGSYNAKISDFGLAKLGPSASQSHLSTTVMGTPGYAAPEYMQTGHLYVKSDVYGFGVVLVEILTGLRAVDLNRPSGRHILTDWIKPELQDRKKLKKVMDPQLGDKYPIKAALPIAKLATSCLAPEPRLRPSMKDVMERLQGIQAATNRTVEVRGAN